MYKRIELSAFGRRVRVGCVLTLILVGLKVWPLNVGDSGSDACSGFLKKGTRALSALFRVKMWEKVLERGRRKRFPASAKRSKSTRGVVICGLGVMTPRINGRTR